MGKGRTPKPIGARESRPGRPPKPEGDKHWLLAPTEVPQAPALLVGDAKAEWERLTPYLEALDRVASIDLPAILTYCMEWSRFSTLMRGELADPKTYLYETGRNHEVPHPFIEPLLVVAKDLLLVAGLFGMTARTRDLDGGGRGRVNSALKRLFGNRRKIAEGKVPQSIVPLLPEWSDTDMRPPAWMNERAKAEFTRLGSELVNLDLFTPLDLVPVSVMACLFDLQLRAYEQLSKTDGLTFVTAWNEEKQEVEEVLRKAHPLHKTISGITNIAKLYWSDYGVTPRNRKLFANEERKETQTVPLIFKGKFAK